MFLFYQILLIIIIFIIFTTISNEIIHWMVFLHPRARSSFDTPKKTGYFTGSSSNSSFLYLSFVASPPRRWRMDL